jgi:hypothetical protein
MTYFRLFAMTGIGFATSLGHGTVHGMEPEPASI